jgi:SAM-dependent methyltransferase
LKLLDVVMNTGFDGPAGRVAAVVMARMNRDMEEAALDVLDPRDGERILVLGFGPGVGIELLLERCAPAAVTGVDPSPVMVAAARRRMAKCPSSDVVTLLASSAADLPRADAPFDAAVAVNSHQLWRPHDATVHSLASALRTGGRLVTVTHDWAIEKTAPQAQWRARVGEDLDAAGFEEPTWSTSRYRSGSGTCLVTTR